MLRVLAVLFLVGLVAATPPVSRTRDEIQEFRHFLESTKTDDGQFLARTKMNPNANAEELSGKYQGDIVLDDFIIEGMIQDYASGRNAYIWPNTKWPQNTVVWDYGDNGVFNDAQRAAIEEGIKDIEEHSCVRFRRRQPNESAYVRVTGLQGGCYAHVGYWQSRGPHSYNLQPSVPGVSCFRHGTIVHEWLHILGFFHMQSTYDRDNYVNIVTQNINPGSLHNFDIYESDLVSNHNIEYDYISCLHYGPYAFSINGLATIVALQQHEGTMGQRDVITDKDWLRLNRHYDCPGAWD